MGLWHRREKVGGRIAYYELTEWWLSAFSSLERQEIDRRYKPMGLSAGTLTRGSLSSSQPVTEFLHGLESWFEGKEDADIQERIHKKIKDLAQTVPIVGPGYYQGRHFTTFVEDVESLKRGAKTEELETLLLHLVEATEAESRKDGQGVAPWYYEELAMLYRGQKKYGSEVSILERFARQKHAPGVTPPKLMERLERARVLANKDRRTGGL